MTDESDIYNYDLLEIQFTLNDEHRKLLSDIHQQKAIITEKNLSTTSETVPNWMHDAYAYVDKSAKEGKNFSQTDICLIHKYLGLEGEFRTRKAMSTSVGYGADYPYFPPDPEAIPTLMEKYEDRFSPLETIGEPLQRICEAYFIYELIHPFEDGNGRTGRLICAWMMIQNNYGFLGPLLEKSWGGKPDHRIAIFKSSNNNYLGCLGNLEVFNQDFSRFYLYFLKETKILLGQILSWVRQDL